MTLLTCKFLQCFCGKSISTMEENYHGKVSGNKFSFLHLAPSVSNLLHQVLLVMGWYTDDFLF